MMSRRKNDNRARSRLSGKRRFILVAALSVGVVVGLGVYAYINRIVVEEVSYESCVKSYGEVVDEWSGGGEERWDEDGYYYQTKSFSINAEAPDMRWPNTAEASPTRISTGGELACDEFEETIDTRNDYRWEGARASSVLFGSHSPEGEDEWLIGEPYNVQDRPDLDVEVLAARENAISWVDDGGSAQINGETLWCVNDEGCHPVSDVNNDKPVRGSGYLHLPDTCPQEHDCRGEWFEDEMLDSLSQDGLVEPFDLRLNALSTYAPGVGTEMLLTFRYPQEVELDLNLDPESTVRVAPGAEAAYSVTIDKYGRWIDEVSMSLDKTDSPIDELEFGDDIKETIDQINLNDSGALEFSVEISDEAATGVCHEDVIELSAQYGEDGIVNEGVEISYCVEPPADTYSYDIQTRGEVTASLGEFSEMISATLADGRGWSRANSHFEEVDSGGDFTMWLASPGEMTSFSHMCSPDYSCRVGDDVIVNDERWQSATDPWNEAGGSLENYRRMVIITKLDTSWAMDIITAVEKVS